MKVGHDYRGACSRRLTVILRCSARDYTDAEGCPWVDELSDVLSLPPGKVNSGLKGYFSKSGTLHKEQEHAGAP